MHRRMSQKMTGSGRNDYLVKRTNQDQILIKMLAVTTGCLYICWSPYCVICIIDSDNINAGLKLVMKKYSNLIRYYLLGIMTWGRQGDLYNPFPYIPCWTSDIHDKRVIKMIRSVLYFRVISFSESRTVSPAFSLNILHKVSSKPLHLIYRNSICISLVICYIH